MRHMLGNLSPNYFERTRRWLMMHPDGGWGSETLGLTAFAAPTLKTVTKKSKVTSCEVSFTPSQDLHGYDSPWPAGGGKNKLPITATTTTTSGVTFTINDDGSISTSNTATDDIVFLVATSLAIDGTNMALNGCPSGGSDSTYYMTARLNGAWSSQHDTGSGLALYGTIDRVAIVVSSGTNMNGLTFYPMIRSTTETNTFAPYANLCPISGWQGAEVTVSGKNLLPMPITSGSYANTMTVSVNDDKSFYVTKTSSSGWTTFDLCTNYYLPSGTYMFIHSDDGSQNCSCDIINADTNITITNTRYVKTRTITLTEGTNITVKYSRSAIADNVLTKLMMFVGTTATASDYVPYRAPSTASVTFGQTILGGTANITDGTGDADTAEVDLGSLTWALAGSGRLNANLPTGIKTVNNSTTMNALCEVYKVTNGQSIANVDMGIAMVNTSNLQVNDSRYNGGDPTAFRTAVTGVKLSYEVATPTPYTFPPASEQLTLAKGTNNAWAEMTND